MAYRLQLYPQFSEPSISTNRGTTRSWTIIVFWSFFRNITWRPPVSYHITILTFPTHCRRPSRKRNIIIIYNIAAAVPSCRDYFRPVPKSQINYGDQTFGKRPLGLVARYHIVKSEKKKKCINSRNNTTCPRRIVFSERITCAWRFSFSLSLHKRLFRYRRRRSFTSLHCYAFFFFYSRVFLFLVWR